MSAMADFVIDLCNALGDDGTHEEAICVACGPLVQVGEVHARIAQSAISLSSLDLKMFEYGEGLEHRRMGRSASIMAAAATITKFWDKQFPGPKPTRPWVVCDVILRLETA